jgi:uncharacterized membrane protein
MRRKVAFMIPKNRNIWRIALSAVVCALYTAVTVSSGEIGFGLVQFRFAEALCLLPFYAPQTIPGLVLGCALSNLIGGYGLPDIIFGSLATLAATITVSRVKNQWLTPLPVIVCNAFIVGGVLTVVIPGTPYWFAAASVGFGELVVCAALGLPLLYALSKVPYFRQLFPEKFAVPERELV